jgi:hypothetical protein
MKQSTIRLILRWIHLIVAIPVLGYVYGRAAEMEQYAGGVRFIFGPILILSGYWMYAGFVFAVIGVTTWLGAYLLTGEAGVAILSQMVLFFLRKIWLLIRARRRASHDGPAMQTLEAGTGSENIKL